MSTKYVLKVGNEFIFTRCGHYLALPEHIPADVVPMDETFTQTDDEHTYIAKRVTVNALPLGYELLTLKQAYSDISNAEYRILGKLSELLHWDSQSRYCSCCGRPMHRATEISKKCPDCHNEVFAPVSPAIIVLVQKEGKALLVRARNFTRPFYGLVAGFVETGESLEECVRREVREETSLEIDNIHYAGSQPWPYPNSLMLGFTADYASGTLRFADGELTDGGFFSIDNLPALPPHPSIARALIEDWIASAK